VRFQERSSGARIALDTAIRATAADPHRGLLRDPRPLPVAVLELKGTAARLPRLLEPVLALGARRASFSKFAAVLEQQGLVGDRAA
jgi:hypothetical protein